MDGFRQVVRVHHQEILIAHEQGKTIIVENRCPHMQASIAQSRISASTLKCPSHGIEFDLITGQALGPAAASCEGGLKFFNAVFDGDYIGVNLS